MSNNFNFAQEIENILERDNFTDEQKCDIRDICSAILYFIEHK